MKENTFELIDVRGVRAVARPLAQDPSSLDVEMPGGVHLAVPRARVHASWDGTHSFEESFEHCLERIAGGQVVIPVVAEEVEIEKRSFERERRRLKTSVSTHDEIVDVPTFHEEIEIVRVPVGRVVEKTASPRQVGDTFIVPVYEEKVVLVTQLILKEEVHVKRKRQERHAQQQVSLRRENVTVEPVHPKERQS